MYNLRNIFELVKNEGSNRENILCTSADNFKLIELKNELIKLHNRNRYTVRPELKRITFNNKKSPYKNAEKRK